MSLSEVMSPHMKKSEVSATSALRTRAVPVALPDALSAILELVCLTDIARGAADEDSMRPRSGDPVVSSDVVVRQVPGHEREVDGLRLSRGQLNLTKAFELLERSDHDRGRGIPNVELHRLGAGARSGVPHVDRHLDRAIGAARGRDNEIPIFKLGVGESVSEGKEWLDLTPVEVAVADEDALTVVCIGTV